MAKISTNISLDADVKAQAQALFADLGLDLSTAVNLFLRQSVRENAIPFSIRRNVPNEETAAAVREVRRMKADPALGKTYQDVDTMMQELLADV